MINIMITSITAVAIRINNNDDDNNHNKKYNNMLNCFS